MSMLKRLSDWLRQGSSRWDGLRYNGDGSNDSPFQYRNAHGPLDSVYTTSLYAKQQVSNYLQSKFPDSICCGRCAFPYPVALFHSTSYEQGSGMFPLCQQCWEELQVTENRLPYYLQLASRWKHGDKVSEETLRRALDRESDATFLRIYECPVEVGK